MKLPSALCAALVVTGSFLAGCGGGEDDDAEKEAGPTYVESESCRSAAAAMLDDAETGAASTDPDEIARYQGAAQAVAADLDCSPNVTSSVSLVTDWLTGYQKAWSRCELTGQFLDLDGDGEPDGTGSCTEADRPFAELKAAIADARALLEVKE